MTSCAGTCNVAEFAICSAMGERWQGWEKEEWHAHFGSACISHPSPLQGLVVAAGWLAARCEWAWRKGKCTFDSFDSLSAIPGGLLQGRGLCGILKLEKRDSQARLLQPDGAGTALQHCSLPALLRTSHMQVCRGQLGSMAGLPSAHHLHPASASGQTFTSRFARIGS